MKHKIHGCWGLRHAVARSTLYSIVLIISGWFCDCGSFSKLPNRWHWSCSCSKCCCWRSTSISVWRSWLSCVRADLYRKPMYLSRLRFLPLLLLAEVQVVLSSFLSILDSGLSSNWLGRWWFRLRIQSFRGSSVLQALCASFLNFMKKDGKHGIHAIMRATFTSIFLFYFHWHVRGSCHALMKSILEAVNCDWNEKLFRR